ncbi:PAAR domain-containing protein [Nissabacter archeti]|uniref:PAAR domain-containing protein n=1 Tax=Nissabacter archeti TaxID=1917880 RepID=A0ABS5JCY6_9GAMM|nr:PAAR domain-containing protein [Nissabacter archeti]MBS0967809.1 PAAR domain-containing protein [Nissabacter archeti]
MAKGYYLVQGDKTTCGGIIIEGEPTHTLFGKPLARERDQVTCGQYAGKFFIAGGIETDTIFGRKIAGTLDSKSTCPCQARLVSSILTDTYEKASGASNSEPEQHAQSIKKKQPLLSSYVTGEKTGSGYVSDYPVLKNTHNLPDEHLRAMLQANNHDVALLTLEECFEVLSSWGSYKEGWVEITQSGPGQILVNYGVNGRDILNAAILINKLGGFDIRATAFVNHKGTELIKISGYPGVRKVLNAPIFSLRNQKVVDIGIGKYGLAKSIVEGARLTIYVAAAYRTVDFILNDETTLAMFIGSLATDVVKIGIASVVSWGAGAGTAVITSFIWGPIAAVVIVGLATAIALNILDEKFGVTDKICKYIEASQQEFAQKAREIEDGIWDLGCMYLDNVLEKGREVLEVEVKRYLISLLEELVSWDLK